MRYGMIMAGGSGTRLWPLSRAALPKQLAPLIGDRSLLEIAFDRLDGLIPAEQRVICAAESHRAAIRKALPACADHRILGEPVGRDTLNAVGFAAAVLAREDPDATIAVFTADHLIEPADRFRDCIDLGFRLIEQNPNRLVTFSIAPTHPATGYGYIERARPIEIEGADDRAFEVKRFVEKPDEAAAREYIDAGTFAWNAGMFVWRAATILRAIERFAPKSHAGLMQIADSWETPKRVDTLERTYPTLPKTSVDYAILEPAGADPEFEVATVVADVDWRDVGSWTSLAALITADESGNRVDAPAGGVTLVDCSETNVFNRSPDHEVAILGAHGLTIVRTDDATLVMPTQQAERLKELLANLPSELR